MIKNRDGSPYKANGSFKLFKPESCEHELFDSWDAEAIRIGGSPLFYYEVMYQSGTIDPVHGEDRGKIFSNIPIQFYGVYEPGPSQNYIDSFGVDSRETVIFDTNRTELLKTIGHPPVIGSRIRTPHLGKDWVIVQNNLGEFKLWGKYRYQIICQLFQESVTTEEGKATQKNNFTIR